MVVALVGVLAFAVRLWSVLHNGGLSAVLGYDEGVYFGASAGLVHGLVPYRDFVLVHPPGSLLLLSPFAELARVVGDPTAWAGARLFVMLVGSANAMMVTVVGRRAGRWAGVIGGVLYAVWLPAVYVERTTMLEAFVLCGLLAALTLLRSPRESTTRLVLAGAALGAASCVKVWGVVPLLVILGWLLVSRAWRSAAVLSAGAAIVAVVVLAPFAALARGRMVDLIVFAQLGRGSGGTELVGRMPRILGLSDVAPGTGGSGSLPLTVVLLGVVLAMMLLAWRLGPARLWVVLLAVQLGVLLAVPVFFAGYSSFVAPALLLVVGAAAQVVQQAVAGRAGSRVAGGVVAVAGTAVVLAAGAYALTYVKKDFTAAAEVTPRLQGFHCVASDSPGVLISTDVLTRDLDRGCRMVFDVDGSVYAVSDGANPDRLTAGQRRRGSAQYQAVLADYFDSADGLVMHRLGADSLYPEVLREIGARPLVWSGGSTSVRGPAPDAAKTAPSSPGVQHP